MKFSSFIFATFALLYAAVPAPKVSGDKSDLDSGYSKTSNHINSAKVIRRNFLDLGPVGAPGNGAKPNTEAKPNTKADTGPETEDEPEDENEEDKDDKNHKNNEENDDKFESQDGSTSENNGGGDE